MDPFVLVTGALAVVFGLVALLQGRRAEEAEAELTRLRHKLKLDMPARLPPVPDPEPTLESTPAVDGSTESE